MVNFLENGFKVFFELGIFQFFCKFLSYKVESVFWKSEGKRSKLFESNAGQKKYFRKWF